MENLGVRFEVVTAETDETCNETDPRALVEALSLRKGRAVWQMLEQEGRELSETVVIASDTVVAADGKILGKPRDKADAERMLRMLSGRAHEVVSGVAVIGKETAGSAHEVTQVIFDTLDDESLAAYLATDEPYDKAGAYAIQGLASAFVKGIHGCYFNVVGLPVHRLCLLFEETFDKKFLEFS